MKPVLRYPGAKWNLAEWIIGHFPTDYENMTYLEPFFGSGAVFFTKRPSKIETINDLDGQVINLFAVIRDNSDELCRLITATPWARDEFYASMNAVEGSNEERARRFLVRCWQGLQARTSHRSGWCNEVDPRGAKSYPKLWQALPGRIRSIAARLLDAQIENRSALELIPKHNLPNVLIYADPPYLKETRTGGSLYVHEMSAELHAVFLDLMLQHQGPAIISGYPSSQYLEALGGWKINTKSVNSGSRGRALKGATEVLWLNPIAAASIPAPRLFENVGGK